VEAWQVRKSDLIPFADTQPTPRVAIPSPTSYLESDLHAHAQLMRRMETVPPIVPRFPVGSWAVHRSGELYHLREYSLFDPRLRFPEGDPFGQFVPWPPSRQTWVVEKYITWLRAGHEPPPLTGLETEYRNITIEGGHHRAEALVKAGRNTCLIWVAVIFIRPDQSGIGLTHELAVMQALHERKPVPYEVLVEYSDV
jgi:hypothetical protein